MPPENFVVVEDFTAIEAYEDLRKQAKIELGNIDPQESPGYKGCNKVILTCVYQTKKFSSVTLQNWPFSKSNHFIPQDSPVTLRKLKFQQVCWCVSFHILYRKNHQEAWECAHINIESDWQKLKFENICEDCRVMDKFGLHKNKFHRLFLDDDLNIYATSDLFIENSIGETVQLMGVTFS